MSQSSRSEENRPLLLQRPVSEDPSADLVGDLGGYGDIDRAILEKNLLRKLDLRMSILVLLALLSYTDRSNVASARLNSFENDLGLEGTEFAAIISALYVGYIFMQVPSNMLLSQITRPSIYLSCCILASGTITFCTGLATRYHEALVARLILGFVEAPFFTGAMFYLGKWYKRQELSERMAYLFFGGLISLAFGSLIASGLLHTMDGMLGYAGWRWVFFVEGALAILVSIAGLFILPDTLQDKSISWLTEAEHALARKRMTEDAPADPVVSDSAASGFLLAMTDLKVYLLAFSAFLTTVSMSFMIYFPTLTATMGYSPTTTLLLCAPPWLTTAFFSLWHSRHSDKTGERCLHVVIPLAGAVCGFLLAISTMNINARYASLYLMSQAVASDVCFYPWVSSTVGVPPAKRAVALAFVNAIAQCGNIIGSYVWVKEWGPTYSKSFGVCTIGLLTSMLVCLYMRRILQELNDRMDLADRRGSNTRWRYHT